MFTWTFLFFFLIKKINGFANTSNNQTINGKNKRFITCGQGLIEGTAFGHGKEPLIASRKGDSVAVVVIVEVIG